MLETSLVGPPDEVPPCDPNGQVGRAGGGSCVCVCVWWVGWGIKVRQPLPCILLPQARFPPLSPARPEPTLRPLRCAAPPPWQVPAEGALLPFADLRPLPAYLSNFTELAAAEGPTWAW